MEAQEPRPQSGPPNSPARLLARAATGLGLKLGLATAVVVCLVVGAGAVSSYVRERDRLLESMQKAAATQGRLTLTGLQFAMLENNRTLLTDLVTEYARSVEVDRVFVTDATGHVSVTSAPSWRGQRVALPADVCPTCVLPTQTRTSVEQVEGRRVLRSLTVIANEPRCLRCHPAVQKTLGTVAVDFSMAPVDQARDAMVTWLALSGAAVALLVLVAVGAVVQLGALAPLRRLRDEARAVAPAAQQPAGLPAPKDEIGELAHEIGRVSSALQDTQAQVDRQRRFLVDLLDHVEDGVAVLDRSLTVIAANQSYLNRVGCDRVQLGRGALRCGDTALCGRSEATDECPTRTAFRNGKLQKRIARHGESGFVEVFASPILGANGQVEQVVEVWRDVTERVALQANLARSEQLAAVGTLASGFSHEISTPLGTVSNSIQGMLRILDRREQLDGAELAALRQRLEVASREVFRCRDITRSLLDLGRRKRTVRDRVRVDQVAARMIEAVRPTAESQGVRLVDGSAETPAVLGHADQLEQVMLNLLMNALEAMPKGGVLRTAVRPFDSGVEAIVEDTGPGVRAEDAERIFEPFFTRKAGGTGLGLYLSRQMIEAHGGRLELVAGERGARFRIFLPLSGGAA